MSNMEANIGFVIKFKNCILKEGLNLIISAFFVLSVFLIELKYIPFVWFSKFSMLGEINSITFIFLACSGFKLRFSFLLCNLAFSATSVVKALIIFDSLIGAMPCAESAAGCAEPITVFWDIAATWELIRIIVPADHAVAPVGYT